jgi:hypothetical protein
MKSVPFFVSALLLSFGIGGCGGDGGDVNGLDTTASIRVTTATIGEDLDPDGYTCRIDGGSTPGTSESTTRKNSSISRLTITTSSLRMSKITARSVIRIRAPFRLTLI